MSQTLTTPGKIMFNQALPEELRSESFRADKKSITGLLTQVAQKYPDKYPEILHNITRLGARVASNSGATISSEGLGNFPERQALANELNSKIQALRASESDPKKFQNKLLTLVESYRPKFQELVKMHGERTNSPTYEQVVSGARGNMTVLGGMAGADLLVADHLGNPVPMPLTNNYGMGLRPSEYFASLYGTRKGLLDTKMAVADAGFFAKQSANAVHRLTVTDDEPVQFRHPVGLPVRPEDTDYYTGLVLAQDVGPYKARTVISPKIAEDLKTYDKRFLVYSPMTSLSKHGGIDRLSAGVRETGDLPSIGANIGIPSAQAVSERLCLAENTKVRMANGTVKNIQDVLPGDYVLGCNEHGVAVKTKVVNVHSNGLRQCYTYKFGVPSKRTTGLEEVTCTEDHRFLCDINRNRNRTLKSYGTTIFVKEIKDLQKSYDIISPTKFDDTGYEDCPYDLLLGLLTGDGCTTQKSSISFSCADPMLMEDIKPYLASLDLKLVGPSGDTKASYNLSGLSRRHNEHTDKIAEYSLRGMHSYDKFISNKIWTWSNKSIGRFIGGYLAADGCISFNKQKNCWVVVFTSTSRQLLTDLRDLLHTRLGILAAHPVLNYEKGIKKGFSESTIRDCFELSINGTEQTAKLLRLCEIYGVKKFKKAEALEYASNKNTDLMKARKFRLLDKINVGMKPTYDLEVEHEDHLFVLANGMITHNSQGMLDSKHTAGVGSRKVNLGGFEYLSNLIQAPENMIQAGPLAPEDGVVQDVRKAPQGGHYIKVNDSEHYIYPHHDIIVKKGQRVEQGDDLTDGIPHPAQLVKYRGIGEARRRYCEVLTEGLKNSGISVHPRNVDTLVTGIINHARVSDPDGIGDFIIDDTLNYNRVFANYSPRKNSQLLPVKQARGKYLEEPVLHYTVGTRINSRVLKDLQDFDIKDVEVHDEKPKFEPYFQRSLLSVDQDEDWQTRLGGWYTARGFQDSVAKGSISDSNSTSFIPAVANPVNVGKDIKTIGRY